MMDYSLCRQTVTLYRRTQQGVLRQVLGGCYLQSACAVSYDAMGRQLKHPFLLVIPGEQAVQVDDLVWEGVGPEIACWEQLVPAYEERLLPVRYVKHYGCHTEAGCRNSAYEM